MNQVFPSDLRDGDIIKYREFEGVVLSCSQTGELLEVHLRTFATNEIESILLDPSELIDFLPIESLELYEKTEPSWKMENGATIPNLRQLLPEQPTPGLDIDSTAKTNPVGRNATTRKEKSTK